MKHSGCHASSWVVYIGSRELHSELQVPLIWTLAYVSTLAGRHASSSLPLFNTPMLRDKQLVQCRGTQASGTGVAASSLSDSDGHIVLLFFFFLA